MTLSSYVTLLDLLEEIKPVLLQIVTDAFFVVMHLRKNDPDMETSLIGGTSKVIAGTPAVFVSLQI